ncbi:hypothetical protein F9C07_2233266 [Aspergillus flavus]|uniref:Uncharacterized protein n=4 Tax=Aspergillus subgen. Circumdati TaxID=2720871 RepID=A0A7U2R0F8_ASPFN|nr:uncharacterized protein G4B84_007221 [Aspergillus flavus NRRL3357]KAB8253027.1 hypothetical protein BDV35DRAFT_127754 [Aspergillus flavus]OOO12086.1 hypothetical protein OAory_01085560 [Aspergillus oryzae]GMG47736.1 unnamed protein product [Aspergillus oryzae var. brunneus]KAF7621255.1 hypothetical protein AFLA_011560 [Aspergillus flavus NRRL3357]KAJ1717691.1 hypothetical protein NYO67_7 [Aspergillus flavus]
MATSQSTGITPASSESLESDLLAHLASTTALDDLHATLLCSLQRMGWTEKVRKLSQELLRGGRCERFDDVVEAVVASAEGRKHPSLAGLDNVNEEDKNSNGDADGYFEKVDVRIPEAVVEQGVRAIKEVLREVVVLDDDSDLLDHHDSHHHAGDGKQEGGGETKTKPSKSSKTGDQSLKNGDTSPVKKTDKKPKPGKQVK